MLGAIAGDIIGSVYERNNVKSKSFPLFVDGSRFTDDTVLTIAIAHVLLTDQDPGFVLRDFYRRYPEAGYGPTFLKWVSSTEDDLLPASDSNGAAMRISPVAWAFDTLEAVLHAARRYTVITHAHPAAITGAQATAAAVYLARRNASKEKIKQYVEGTFNYDLSVPLDEIRPNYSFDITCAGTVPYAIRAFLEATDFEDAVRNAISIGGDSDTLACIAGAIAEAFFGGVPQYISDRVQLVLDEPLQNVLQEFTITYLLHDKSKH